jgi:hypothetical protein
MDLTVTLQVEMHQGAWLSNPSTQVRFYVGLADMRAEYHPLEMLTPIDQPLDKLQDLTKSEM